MPLSSCMTFSYAFTSITYDTAWRGEPFWKPENALRALFCEKMDLTWESMRGVWAIFISPQIAQKGRGHLKHDFCLTAWLLPDWTMTFKGRSDSLVVESERKKNITFKCMCHLRDL